MEYPEDWLTECGCIRKEDIEAAKARMARLREKTSPRSFPRSQPGGSPPREPEMHSRGQAQRNATAQPPFTSTFPLFGEASFRLFD